MMGTKGTLGKLGFTEQHCTGITQAIHHRRRVGWTKVFHHQGSGRGGYPLGIKQVLDSNGHTMK